MLSTKYTNIKVSTGGRGKDIQKQKNIIENNNYKSYIDM